MSQTENSFSDSSVESESMVQSEYEENDGNLNAKSTFEPYQGEPLASISDSESSEDDEDEDGILPSVMEQRMDKIIPISSWCSCGNCASPHLVSAREYRCCKEIVEVTGKFTFIGENVVCILDHPDFTALTNETVLRQVGPLLRNKNGNPYKIKNGADKKFLRAVSYRWLARWLFGRLDWENTRPLSACVYNFIRTSFSSSDVKGYIPGEERADKDN